MGKENFLFVRFCGNRYMLIAQAKNRLAILPILGVLYTICLVDRGNISVARISGLDKDLELDSGVRASIAPKYEYAKWKEAILNANSFGLLR
jgi:hypothetical protein